MATDAATKGYVDGAVKTACVTFTYRNHTLICDHSWDEIVALNDNGKIVFCKVDDNQRTYRLTICNEDYIEFSTVETGVEYEIFIENSDDGWRTRTHPIKSTLNGLSDTAFAALQDGQILQYDSNTGKWKNANPPSGGGSAGQLTVTDDDNGNIGLSLTGGSQSLSVTDDNNGNITLTLS